MNISSSTVVIRMNNSCLTLINFAFIKDRFYLNMRFCKHQSRTYCTIFIFMKFIREYYFCIVAPLPLSLKIRIYLYHIRIFSICLHCLSKLSGKQYLQRNFKYTPSMNTKILKVNI